MANLNQIELPNGGTYNFEDTEGRKEENLQWGGNSHAGEVSPIGMSLSNEHSANRIAYINGASLYFEYSSDSGSSWTNYGYSDAIKSQFCTTSYGVPIGRASNSTNYSTSSRTRITLTAQNGTTGHVYTNPRKMLINISSSGGMQVLVETRTGTNYQSGGAWSTFGTYTLQGWSGWNDIPLILGTLGGGTTQTNNNWQLRLTFIMTSFNSDYPTTAQVSAIRIYGENGWTTTSNMGSTGHLYSYDASQNAIFPANVQINNGKQVGYLTATPTSGQVVVADGTSGGIKTSGYTIAKSVPSNAAFTDTTYTFANGTNGFTVTPSGGSAQTVTVTPSITNNITGSGTSGYIAKFNGANTITSGPAIGSGTTKFLREDGTWQTPPGGSDTTYTIGTSGNNIILTPSSGSVQSITAPYATSAGSAGTASSVAWDNVSNKPITLASNSDPLSTNGWKTLGGRSSGSKITVSYATDYRANWNSEAYSATILFGAQDTKGFLDCGYSTPTVTFGGGSVGGSTDDNPTWYWKLSGTSGKTYILPTDTSYLAKGDSSGNALSATTASKLGSSTVGSATNPVYLSSGTATTCTYSLNKTVPSDAVFTDTTYSAGTGLSLSGTTFNSKIWEGTQAQYDALTTKDSDTTYYITDGGVNGPLGLDDLSDVDIATTPTEGEILVYNSSTSTWKNSGSNSVLSVRGLSATIGLASYGGYVAGNRLRAVYPDPIVPGGYIVSVSINGNSGTISCQDPTTSEYVQFPHNYSATEHCIGYWVDGKPIYEKTIELSSEVTIAAGNTSAAGSWTVVQTGWTTPIYVIDFLGYRFSTTGDPTYMGHLTAQWERANNRIKVLNIRSQTMLLSVFTIRYIYEG